MDQISRQTQRAMALAKRINLEARLARFEIDASTFNNLRIFTPKFIAHIDRVVIRFYEYLGRFPETQAILKGHNIDSLRDMQKRHWLQLFSGRFGVEYVNRSLMIGLAHFNARVPPHIYIASYSFFLNELLRIPGESNTGYDFRAIAISINKVVMLDMSIVLNAYMLDSLAAEVNSPGAVQVD